MVKVACYVKEQQQLPPYRGQYLQTQLVHQNKFRSSLAETITVPLYCKSPIGYAHPQLYYQFLSALGTCALTFKPVIFRPILKQTCLNSEVPSDYRPISLLSFLIKVVEVVVKQITFYPVGAICYPDFNQVSGSTTRHTLPFQDS